MALRARKLARGALLAILGAALALAAGELFLRAFPRFLSEQDQLRLLWKELGSGEPRSLPHATIGSLPRPNTVDEIERGDLRYTAHLDEHGFRNARPWPARAEIVAVGDSLTFSYGVDDDEAWTAIVDAGLPDVRVLDLGLVGGAPEQYLAVYEAFGAALRPEVVLVGLYPTNDFLDARQFQAWLDAGRPESYDLWRFHRGARPGWRRWLAENCRLLMLLRSTRGRLRGGGPFSARTLELEGGRVRLVPDMLFDWTRGSFPGEPGYELVFDALARLRERTEADGARLVVLLFPSKEEVYVPTLDEPCPDPTARTLAELRKRGYRCLDLTPPLRERAERGEKVFLEVDMHPNAAGYRVIGETVLAYLRERASELGLR